MDTERDFPAADKLASEMDADGKSNTLHQASQRMFDEMVVSKPTETATAPMTNQEILDKIFIGIGEATVAFGAGYALGWLLEGWRKGPQSQSQPQRPGAVYRETIDSRSKAETAPPVPENGPKKIPEVQERQRRTGADLPDVSMFTKPTPEGLRETNNVLTRFSAGKITEDDLRGIEAELNSIKEIEARIRQQGQSTAALQQQITQFQEFSDRLTGKAGEAAMIQAKAELAQRANEAKSNHLFVEKLSTAERSNGRGGRLAGALILSALILGYVIGGGQCAPNRPNLPTPSNK